MNVVYPNFTPETTAPTVPGSVISYGIRGAPAFERAIIAAKMRRDGVGIVGLTVSQLAALFDVSATYVRAALHILDNAGALDAVLKGRANLLAAAGGSWDGSSGNGHCNGEALVDRFIRSSKEERAEMVRTVGVDQVWDQLVFPFID
jgi:hypothetical protein